MSLRKSASELMTGLCPPRSTKGVIILSGGMDSVTLLHFLKKELHCDLSALSFNYGQKHNKELGYARDNCKDLGIPHHIIDLPFVGSLFNSHLLSSGQEIPEGHYADENMKKTVVPNRNMIMSSIAVGYGQSNGAAWLCLGVHQGDHDIYPDCRREFVEAFRKAVELSDWHPFTVFAPFQELNKSHILSIGYALTQPVDYGKTWTCYKGLPRACGKCGSCTERLEAFLALTRQDPCPYDPV